MLERLSPDEWADWLAYYSLYPFGRPTEDDYWRGLYQMYWSVNSSGKQAMPKFIDRDPQPVEKPPIALGDKVRFFLHYRVKKA